MDWSEKHAPSATDIEALADAAIADLPEVYRAEAAKVVLRVEEVATEDMMEELGLADAFELTGLYDGIPLTQKSIADQPVQPDTIWLFRRAILDEWIDRGNVGLGTLVAHVYVHELAHHFGWSDADIAKIDPWWE